MSYVQAVKACGTKEDAYRIVYAMRDGLSFEDAVRSLPQPIAPTWLALNRPLIEATVRGEETPISAGASTFACQRKEVGALLNPLGRTGQ